MTQKYHLAEYAHRFATTFANTTIIRHFDYERNKWVKLNGSEVSELCLDAAKGFAREGLEVGERVGFYHPNLLNGLTAELGLFMMRGVSVPIYSTSTPEQVDYIVRDAEIKLIFVGDQFQYNNAYEVQQKGQMIKRIIIFDSDVVLAQDDRTSVYYDEFIRRGDSKNEENIANVRASEALATDLGVIIYTSGTSGRPKGVPIHHQNMMIQIAGHTELFPFLTSKDTTLSFLPMSHIFEKVWGYFCLRNGITVAILRDPKRILEVLPIIRPTIMCNVPRFWEKVYAGVKQKIEHSPNLIQRIMRHAISVGKSYNFDYISKGKDAPFFLKLMNTVYDKTLFSKLKRVLGLHRGRFFPTAGAALSDEVCEFLISVGIPICYGYGLSESTATVSFFPMKGFKLGSIGEVIDGLEVRIDPETNEIQLRGESIIKAYYNNPEADKESFTEDGFFRTGDAGRLEGRTLYFTERIKDLFKTANGKYIAPQMLENLITVDPLIEQAAIIGDGYKFVSALLCPNWEMLRKEAEARGISATLTNEELASDHEVHRLVMAHLEGALGTVAQYEKVKRFTLLTEAFSTETGELTTTLKLKRKVIKEKYAEEIKQMYDDSRYGYQ